MRNHDLLDFLIIEPSFTDSLDDTPYVFQFDATPNPMDADDPETALRHYYKQVRGN
jgi:hypothetical protein